jgi:SAM-dependent methyltransferase
MDGALPLLRSPPMRWLVKATAQNLFSVLPRGERLNYQFQRRVIRSLPTSDARFRRKLVRAFQHFDAFARYGKAGEPVFYEFGAGWDLAVPLAYYGLGVERQILVDIRPIVRLELVNDSIRKFEASKQELEEAGGRSLRPLGAADVSSLAELEERFGIRYLAPCDARDTGLPAQSIDFISSTDTMEHIPEDDLLRILVECRRLLKPEGLMSYRIGMEDHYAYFDRSVSHYNFLRFPDPVWRLLNPALHYQSRLRHPDYVRLARAAGLEIVEDRPSRPTEADLATLRGMKLARRFRDAYAREELGIKAATFVVRPRESVPAEELAPAGGTAVTADP